MNAEEKLLEERGQGLIVALHTGRGKFKCPASPQSQTNHATATSINGGEKKCQSFTDKTYLKWQHHKKRRGCCVHACSPLGKRRIVGFLGADNFWKGTLWHMQPKYVVFQKLILSRFFFCSFVFRGCVSPLIQEHILWKCANTTALISHHTKERVATPAITKVNETWWPSSGLPPAAALTEAAGRCHQTTAIINKNFFLRGTRAAPISECIVVSEMSRLLGKILQPLRFFMLHINRVCCYDQLHLRRIVMKTALGTLDQLKQAVF